MTTAEHAGDDLPAAALDTLFAQSPGESPAPDGACGLRPVAQA
jgi:hypothetical protein